MSNKCEIITVSKEQIIQLQAGAKSFRQAFYVLFESMTKPDDGGIKFNDGDLMSVLGTIGCLSIELYLKFLSVILSFNDSKKEGVHIKCHSLDKLFEDIAIHYPQKANEILNDIDKFYSKTPFNFIDFLDSIKEGFIDWRYAYSKGDLHYNLNHLSSVLNALETISNDLCVPISKSLIEANLKKNNQQSMTFDDINSIECEIFPKCSEDD